MINVNFRVPPKLLSEIARAAEIAQEDKAEIVRRALAIGMELMRVKGYNILDVYLSGEGTKDPPSGPIEKITHIQPSEKAPVGKQSKGAS